MAGIVKDHEIPVDKIYKVSEQYSWSLDFYNRRPVTICSTEECLSKHDIWIYASEKELETLKKKGIEWDLSYSADQFRITRLQARFMDPAKRSQVVNQMYLVHIP